MVKNCLKLLHLNQYLYLTFTFSWPFFPFSATERASNFIRFCCKFNIYILTLRLLSIERHRWQPFAFSLCLFTLRRLFTSLGPQDPKILKVLHLRQGLSTDLDRANYIQSRSMASDFEVLIFIYYIILYYYIILEVLAWWSQHEHIICKKQICNCEVPEPDRLQPLALPRNCVNKKWNEQNWW